MTSVPFVRRTLATLRMAEFGFFGVRVMTCTQTPRRKGLPCNAGALDFATTLRRPFLTSWLMVGMWLDGSVWKVEKARNLPEQEPPARTISRLGGKHGFERENPEIAASQVPLQFGCRGCK